MRAAGNRRGLASLGSFAKAVHCRFAARRGWRTFRKPVAGSSKRRGRSARSRIEAMPSEPRLRILIAEVQARCGTPFAATDATLHEEKLSRQNARLRLLLASERQARNRNDRFVQALGCFRPGDSPEEWASRAALVWCAEPDVNGAQCDLG